MAEGRQKLEWEHTSQLLAMIWNRTRWSEDDTSAEPDDFDPYERIRPEKKAGMTISIMQLGELVMQGAQSGIR